jgi:hypothetical protein
MYPRLKQRRLLRRQNGHYIKFVEPQPRFGQVVKQLPLQPRFGATAKRLIKPQRHFGRDACLAAQQVSQSLTADAQYGRPFGDGQVEPLQAVLPDGDAWMDKFGICHGRNDIGE